MEVTQKVAELEIKVHKMCEFLGVNDDGNENLGEIDLSTFLKELKDRREEMLKDNQELANYSRKVESHKELLNGFPSYANGLLNTRDKALFLLNNKQRFRELASMASNLKEAKKSIEASVNLESELGNILTPARVLRIESLLKRAADQEKKVLEVLDSYHQLVLLINFNLSLS